MKRPGDDSSHGRSGVLLLGEGSCAFTARGVLARLAARSLDLQYYVFDWDVIGSLLVHELLGAADRGVRVRLLLDDISGEKGDDSWVAFDAHRNTEVRYFNPWLRTGSRALQYVTRWRHINHRMHAKSFTVDNQMTIVGGRNIADEYFGADPDLAFSDLDALAVGPVASQVTAVFERYWSSEHACSAASLIRRGTEAELAELRSATSELWASDEAAEYVEALDDSPLAHALRTRDPAPRSAVCKVVSDPPGKKDIEAERHPDLLISELAPHITAAETDLVIVSPYFVPSERAAGELCRLARGGVRVRVLTNSLASNDVPAVHAGYAKYRIPMLRCGVELYEFDETLKRRVRSAFMWTPGRVTSSLHAKTIAIDRELLFVGSFNFDRRSLHLNNEIGLLVADREVASEVTDSFDEHIDEVAFRVELDESGALSWRGQEHGREVVLSAEPHAELWLRLAVRLAGLLPLESQL